MSRTATVSHVARGSNRTCALQAFQEWHIDEHHGKRLLSPNSRMTRSLSGPGILSNEVRAALLSGAPLVEKAVDRVSRKREIAEPHRSQVHADTTDWNSRAESCRDIQALAKTPCGEITLIQKRTRGPVDRNVQSQEAALTSRTEGKKLFDSPMRHARRSRSEEPPLCVENLQRKGARLSHSPRPEWLPCESDLSAPPPSARRPMTARPEITSASNSAGISQGRWWALRTDLPLRRPCPAVSDAFEPKVNLIRENDVYREIREYTKLFERPDINTSLRTAIVSTAHGESILKQVSQRLERQQDQRDHQQQDVKQTQRRGRSVPQRAPASPTSKMEGVMSGSTHQSVAVDRLHLLNSLRKNVNTIIAIQAKLNGACMPPKLPQDAMQGASPLSCASTVDTTPRQLGVPVSREFFSGKLLSEVQGACALGRGLCRASSETALRAPKSWHTSHKPARVR